MLMDRKSDTTETDRVGVYYKAMAVTAVIAGFVAAVLVVGLTVNYIQGKVVEPSLTEQLDGLKLIVKEQPDNASVVEHMRQLDLELRRITFRRLDKLTPVVSTRCFLKPHRFISSISVRGV